MMPLQIHILDSSVIKSIIEGNKVSEKILLKLEGLNQQKNTNNRVLTTLSSFLNAIYISSPNLIIKNIQRIMEVIDIKLDDIDYKNIKQVKDKIINFANQAKGI